jgi:hypothetical protein
MNKEVVNAEKKYNLDKSTENTWSKCNSRPNSYIVLIFVPEFRT